MASALVTTNQTTTNTASGRASIGNLAKGFLRGPNGRFTWHRCRAALRCVASRWGSFSAHGGGVQVLIVQLWRMEKRISTAKPNNLGPKSCKDQPHHSNVLKVTQPYAAANKSMGPTLNEYVSRCRSECRSVHAQASQNDCSILQLQLMMRHKPGTRRQLQRCNRRCWDLKEEQVPQNISIRFRHP